MLVTITRQLQNFTMLKKKLKPNLALALFFCKPVSLLILSFKKDVFDIAGINVRKSLTYQVISEVTREIFLVISPTIALIKD